MSHDIYSLLPCMITNPMSTLNMAPLPIMLLTVAERGSFSKGMVRMVDTVFWGIWNLRAKLLDPPIQSPNRASPLGRIPFYH